MDLKEVMATNLRRLRHAKGMTQEELAERAGLSARYIGAIERADVSASVTVLGQVAEALEVEPADLVRRTLPDGQTTAPSERQR
jgi:transcriptional regulator with XRE-family HTH domain